MTLTFGQLLTFATSNCLPGTLATSLFGLACCSGTGLTFALAGLACCSACLSLTFSRLGPFATSNCLSGAFAALTGKLTTYVCVAGLGEDVLLNIVPAVELAEFSLLGVGAVVGINNCEYGGFGLGIELVVGYDNLAKFNPVFTAGIQNHLALELRIILFYPVDQCLTALVGYALVGSDGSVDGATGVDHDGLEVFGLAAVEQSGYCCKHCGVAGIVLLDLGALQGEEDIGDVFSGADACVCGHCIRASALALVRAR